MKSRGRKVQHQASGKSGLPGGNVSSKMATSDKDIGKRYYSKRYKPKQRSQVRTIGSILAKTKRRGSEFSSNGSKKNPRIRRKSSHKFSDTNSFEKPLSSFLQGGKPCLHERGTDGDLGAQKVGRRRKRKKENREQDETVRLQRRTRYLLIKMKLEHNLIDAYSGEGWKGQSREKIKPVRELQRAKKQILKCKLGIRDAIHQLELLSSEGCIEQSVLGPDGSVYHEHIFCAKCKSRDAFPDNDIILCDGTCNCAFHQKCLEPPLATENIPPGDQGWFCKFCECKMEILEAVNAHLGTHFPTDSNWQDVFKEAAMGPDENASLNPEDEWPSDESDDDDYDPETNELSCSFSRTSTEDDMADEASSSSSFFWTSDEEAYLQSKRLFENDGSPKRGFYHSRNKGKDFDRINLVGSSAETTDHEIRSRRRQRRNVDYKKLHDEMFGKDVLVTEQVSEDEDWGPGRRRRRLNETDAAGTLVALCGNGDDQPVESKKKLLSVPEDKRTLFRIPADAVEKLRSVFAENELPSRDVKENLSKQLGIASEKINKWFKNARYMALKIRKEDSTKQLHTSATAKESTAADRDNQTTDLLASNPNSYPVSSDNEGVQLTKNLRKVRRRKNTKSSIISPTKRQRRKRTAGALARNINKVSTLSNNNPLNFRKKATTILKTKSAIEEKEIIIHKYEQVTSNKTEQLYFTEIERLCYLQAKITEMKKYLLTIHNVNKNVTDQNNHDEKHVIYVPVSEVRVKR